VLTPHLIRLAFGLPSLTLVMYALKKGRDSLHPMVWMLAVVTAVAPLATGYVWTWSPTAGIFYALLTYGAALGFAMRLVYHVPYRYHWPLLMLFTTSAMTAFITIAWVVLPMIHEVTVASDLSDADADAEIQQTLGRIDAALANMEMEQQKVQSGVRTVVEQIKVGGSRIRNMQQRRDKLMEELRAAQKLKELSDEELAELSDRLHKTHWMDNIVSFLVGVASSVTATFALKFFVSSD
jgi:hypothetical protein